MAKGMTAIRFLFAYAMFLGFFLLIIGLGGAQYVAESFECTTPGQTNCVNITSLQQTPQPTLDPLGSLVYIINNIGLLFTLMVINPLHPSIIVLHFIITLPALIVLIYIVLVLIRGGGA